MRGISVDPDPNASDGGSHELRGLPVDDDVPAEQYAVDDLSGTPRRVVWADGVLGYHPGL